MGSVNTSFKPSEGSQTGEGIEKQVEPVRKALNVTPSTFGQVIPVVTGGSAERVERARQAVITEAREWLRTPFHHEGQIKGEKGGVDCAQFLNMCYTQALGAAPIKVEHYPADWHMHCNVERFRNQVHEFCYEIKALADVRPADLALFHFGKVYSHGAIVIEWPLLIHASMQNGCVEYIDADLDPHLQRCAREFYRPLIWQGAD